MEDNPTLRSGQRGAGNMEIPDWAAVYCEYRDLIRAYIYGRVSDPYLADDLAADVFTKAIASYANGRGAKSHFRGWLYKIASNLVIDYYRRRAKVGHMVELEEMQEIGIDGYFEGALMAEQIERALRRLSEGQSVAIRGTIDGYSGLEIGELLGSSEGAAKALLHRARVTLRGSLVELRYSDGEAASIQWRVKR